MHTIFKHEEALPQMSEIQTDFCFGHDCASYLYQLDLEARKITLNLRANQELMSFYVVEFEGYYEH